MIDYEDIEIGDLMYHRPDGIDNSKMLTRVIKKRYRGDSPNLIVKILEYSDPQWDFTSSVYTKGDVFNYDYNSTFGHHCEYGKNKDDLLIELI